MRKAKETKTGREVKQIKRGSEEKKEPKTGREKDNENESDKYTKTEAYKNGREGNEQRKENNERGM
jgi:hypothetical protein